MLPVFILQCLVPLLVGILVIVLGIVFRKKMPTVLFVILLLAGIIIAAYGVFWIVIAIGISAGW
ncbi:MAG: hypothetical protein LIO37_00530 [Clostridiales bacterium]|nr:hypothetical protein [Clostridiales bacterium]